MKEVQMTGARRPASEGKIARFATLRSRSGGSSRGLGRFEQPMRTPAEGEPARELATHEGEEISMTRSLRSRTALFFF